MKVNCQMPWTQRAQKVSRVKDFAGSEYTSRLALHTDDALGRCHHERCGKRVDISPRRHRATFLASRAGYYFYEESLR